MISALKKTNDNDIVPPKYRTDNLIELADNKQFVDSNSYSYAYLGIS